MDVMEIEVLADGTIKTSTNKVSMANHANAEGFLRMLAQLTGGESKRTLKIGASLHGALHKHASDGHTHAHGGAGHSH